MGIDSEEGVLEILSQCLHRSRRVVYKTDVLHRIFVRSFDLWNWQIFELAPVDSSTFCVLGKGARIIGN